VVDSGAAVDVRRNGMYANPRNGMYANPPSPEALRVSASHGTVRFSSAERSEPDRHVTEREAVEVPGATMRNLLGFGS
jgi:hypothetical protein